VRGARPRQPVRQARADPEPNPEHDIIVDGFPDLAAALGVAL